MRASVLFAIISVAACWSGLGLWWAAAIACGTLALLHFDRRRG